MEECTLHLYANTVEPVKKFAIGLYGQKVSVEIHPEEYQGWTIVTFKCSAIETLHKIYGFALGYEQAIADTEAD